MDFLIREVTYEQGQIVYQDTEISSDLITIGSAPNQLIQLRGGSIAREHAVFKEKAGKLSIAGINNNKFIVNGKRVGSSALRRGDEIELETHRIKIVQPPTGFDAACELSIDEELQENAFKSAYVTQLSDTFLGKRFPSYMMSLLVVIAVLAWPLSAYFNRTADAVNKDAEKVSQRLEERLGSKIYAGGGDVLWSTGPLLPAHQLEIGDDCSACHKKAFQKVQDEACMDCHQGTADHFDKTMVDKHFVAGVSLCQSCHKEHNEPAMIVVESDTLCVECHQDSIEHSDKSLPKVEAVSGFFETKHPPFKLEFLLPKITTEEKRLKVEWYKKLVEAGSKQKEVSNLKFPHDIHLDVDKVQTLNTNEAMACSDCHTLKSDNEHFEEITMERHCSQCHNLTFDIADPDRQLPHGDPRSVVQSIEEHFVRVYTDPNFKPADKKDRRRRRPGVSRTAETCDNTPFNCAIRRATKEAGTQFTQRGCVTCHEVSDNGSKDLYSRWTVLPVKINQNWYARAQFDHLSHLTQHGVSENETCSSCHKAQVSTVSSDVMIPDINNCLICHGDQEVEEKVSVNCISCHGFHPEPQKM